MRHWNSGLMITFDCVARIVADGSNNDLVVPCMYIYTHADPVYPRITGILYVIRARQPSFTMSTVKHLRVRRYTHDNTIEHRA